MEQSKFNKKIAESCVNRDASEPRWEVKCCSPRAAMGKWKCLVDNWSHLVHLLQIAGF